MFLKYCWILLLLFAFGCSDDEPSNGALDPDTAPKVSVDRFSEDAGTLMVRTADNGLPGANVAVDFDQAPFITQGLSPDGKVVKYYNFDVMSTTPAPIFVLFKEGATMPVDGQLNIIDVIPGDAGYNDFWHVHKVIVPNDYVANTVTSYADISAGNYTIEKTNIIVNCPVVPDGSTANLRMNGAETGLTRGWYKNKVVFYFNFVEKDLTVPNPDNPVVALSDILVTFNTNGDPSTGFMTENDGVQTHNVVETIPSDNDYSPLWDVDVYDNADFDNVHDYSSAMSATILATSVATVNCPIVFVGN